MLCHGKDASWDFTVPTIWRLRLVYPICLPPEAINAHSTDSLLFQKRQKFRHNPASGVLISRAVVAPVITHPASSRRAGFGLGADSPNETAEAKQHYQAGVY